MSTRRQTYYLAVDDEPIDRRGLLRALAGQAARAVIPGMPARTPQTPRDPLPARYLAREELRSAARRFALDERTDALESLARESLRLAPTTAAGDGSLVFGGRPLLPAGEPWPTWGGRQLTFLARLEHPQIDGALLFFYELESCPSGQRASHAGAARVIRVGDERLIGTHGPSRPSACSACRAAVELVLPRAFSAQADRLGLSAAEQANWEALRGHLAKAQGTVAELAAPLEHAIRHRLLGYPDETGGSMPLVCELGSRGRDSEPIHPLMLDDARELERESVRWELLAQLSADAALGWTWSPRRLYFWIDREDRRSGDTRSVWAVLA